MNKSNEQVSFDAGVMIAQMIEESHGQALTENQEDRVISAWGMDASNLGLPDEQVAYFQAGMDAYFLQKSDTP